VLRSAHPCMPGLAYEEFQTQVPGCCYAPRELKIHYLTEFAVPESARDATDRANGPGRLRSATDQCTLLAD
jgi:hypothetical protein